jgi:hypothetical protein
MPTRINRSRHPPLAPWPATADLNTYQDHPEHQAVVKELILPLKEDIMALDYIEGAY